MIELLAVHFCVCVCFWAKDDGYHISFPAPLSCSAQQTRAVAVMSLDPACAGLRLKVHAQSKRVNDAVKLPQAERLSTMKSKAKDYLTRHCIEELKKRHSQSWLYSAHQFPKNTSLHGKEGPVTGPFHKAGQHCHLLARILLLVWGWFRRASSSSVS
mmetsp:Transcript_67565/g.156840  ORF Transcript_67565/g.156840 Transcript_67565/m.156840 type:complete len:157 (-) Transcript_67565:295-765(-)